MSITLCEALQLGPEARAAFLTIACVDEPELRLKLERLLVHSDRTEGVALP